MAILKNVTISDVGFERIPQGSTGQRPTTFSVSLSGITGGISIARDGLQLYIPYPGSPWTVYQGLPDYLKGLQCTISINDTDAGSVTYSQPTRTYMMRNPGWNLVDTSGWTTVETGQSYISSQGATLSVFYRDFTAGTYSIDNNSAMYFFSPVAIQSNPQGTNTYAGAVRFNTTYQVTEVYNGAEWRPLNDSVTNGTGGTISGASIGGYKIHTFTSNGTFTPAYSGAVEVLVIGGGGGGSGLAGGGGGGGYVYNSSFNVIGGLAYPVVVGTAGTGSTTHTNNTASSGNPSYFGTPQSQIIGYGGGQGAHWYSPASPGQSPQPVSGGGSGGGGPGYGYSPGTRPGGTGVIGQGHPGGWGHHGSGPANTQASYPQPGICVYGGGGGGGAGQRGFDRQNVFFEAKGGDGMASTIANTGQTFYAAGGGGGAHGPSGNHARDANIGGLGGGGYSYSGGPSAIQPANPTSVGSGGAGQWHPDTYNSGNGSNGIVIVRYRN